MAKRQEQKTAVGVYLVYIDDFLTEQGYPSEFIFNAAGFSYPGYVQQGERVSLAKVASLVSLIKERVNLPEFFLRFGERTPVMANGQLGQAVLACKDVRTALALSQRYSSLVFTDVKIALQEEGEYTVVDIQAKTASADLNKAFVEAMIGTFVANMARLTGEAFFPKSISVMYSKSECHYLDNAYPHCEVQFSAPGNSFIISDYHLDLPITTADKLGEKLLAAQCEDELAKMQSNTSLAARIRQIIVLYLEASPTILFVAEKLRVSERTLRRRLAEEGICFRDLLKDIRHETAIDLLQNTDMRIERIAWKLGYKETANFRKAFKLRIGISPREWRDSGGREER